MPLKGATTGARAWQGRTAGPTGEKQSQLKKGRIRWLCVPTPAFLPVCVCVCMNSILMFYDPGGDSFGATNPGSLNVGLLSFSQGASSRAFFSLKHLIHSWMDAEAKD